MRSQVFHTVLCYSFCEITENKTEHVDVENWDDLPMIWLLCTQVQTFEKSSEFQIKFQMFLFYAVVRAGTTEFDSRIFEPSSKFNRTFAQPFKEICMSEVVRIGSIIIFHLNKRCKAKFSILCDVIFLVRLQGKFEVLSLLGVDWKGQ